MTPYGFVSPILSRHFAYLLQTKKKLEGFCCKPSSFSGDSWTRTNDPFDVNEVLYRLSHATKKNRMARVYEPPDPLEQGVSGVRRFL